MGNGMNKILPGLYVGNFRDAKDPEQLKTNNITHILSIHDHAKKLRDDIEYKCVLASDTPDQDLTQFFSECIDFIHDARIKGGNVLVHCLAGVSRSVTITAAYMMTVTKYGWKDCLNAVRGARSFANPNFGFQKQLQTFDAVNLQKERERVKTQFVSVAYDDNEECRHLLDAFQRFVLHGDPNMDDGLLSLPHRAYKDQSESRSTTIDEQSKTLTTGVKSESNTQRTESKQKEDIKNHDSDNNEETTSGAELNAHINPPAENKL